MKKVAFHNLGCKVNSYEMEYMQQEFEKNGYEIVPFAAIADIYVVNTCTVTNIADRKSRQMLHQAKKRNPEALVVAAGCYAQTADRDRTDAAVDLYVGNNRKKEIVTIVEEALKEGRSQRKVIDDLTKPTEYEDLFLKKTMEHTRVSVKVQDGCNQFCSYCIIPFARGRTVSRSKDDILEEIRGLAALGVKEFVITGIHVSSYGYDIKYPDAKPKADCFAPDILIDLLQSIDATEGVERIRLSSLEPRIITEEFAAGLKSIKGLCPHFHLSLQSGCDSVLKRMNRHYDTGDYENCVRILRDTFDDPAITTDVIVGFPGETEEEFVQSHAFAEKTGFYQMHIFKYSKRKGTVAAGMPGQLTEAQKAERSDRMEEIERKMTEAYITRYIGREAEVLYEEEEVIGGQNMLTGYTREYIRVAVKTAAKSGDIRRILLKEGPEAGILSGVEL